MTLSRNDRSLRLALLSASLATACAAALTWALASRHDSPAPAPSSASRTLYVAPTGSDSGRCASAQSPCGSFDAAYQAARPGDVVLVAGGDYPSQSIEGDESKDSPRDVVFEPAPGASAPVRLTGPLYVYGSHLTLEGLHAIDVTIGNYDQTPGRPNPTDVSLRGVVGRDFEIDSATHVTISGGSWGPSSACGGPYGGGNNSIRDVTGVVPADILIDRVVIHDVQSYDLVKCHIEGLAIFAGHGVTVSRSRFYGNSVYDAFLQANSGPVSGVTFKGNWMAMPVGLDGRQNGTVIGFSDVNANVLVARNRFNYVISLDDDGLNPVYKDFRLVGNVGMLPYLGCTLRGIRFERNIWQKGACSSSDVNLHGARLPYRKGANDATLDYAIPRRYARLLARR